MGVHDEGLANASLSITGVAVTRQASSVRDPSPIEQSNRSIDVLSDAIPKGLVSSKRLGITARPRLESLVLVSNYACSRSRVWLRLKWMDRIA